MPAGGVSYSNKPLIPPGNHCIHTYTNHHNLPLLSPLFSSSYLPLVPCPNLSYPSPSLSIDPLPPSSIMSKRGPLGLTLSQFQDLLDTTPSLQVRGHVNASLYGWVPGTKGVWVLEAPTNEQYARLRSLPPATTPTIQKSSMRVCEM